MPVLMEYSATILLFLSTVDAQSLSLDPTNLDRTCIAANNKTGMCVDESICNEEHTILPGGDIIDSDMRIMSGCPPLLWCCTSWATTPPVIGDAKSEKCVAPLSDDCPWCVLLFKSIRGEQTAPFPYCLGALIGSRVIITAATCIKSAQKKTPYAQISNSTCTGKNYTVIRHQFHPQYNTGSHAYDFGILVLEEDVTFNNERSYTACLDFQASFEGICIGYGFDIHGIITSTVLDVENKSCGRRGYTNDSACGSKRDLECIVNTGSPIICGVKGQEGNGLYLLGVARDGCRSNDKVLLGGISHSKQWLETELANMKVTSGVYAKGGDESDFIYRQTKYNTL